MFAYHDRRGFFFGFGGRMNFVVHEGHFALLPYATIRIGGFDFLP